MMLRGNGGEMSEKKKKVLGRLGIKKFVTVLRSSSVTLFLKFI